MNVEQTPGVETSEEFSLRVYVKDRIERSFPQVPRALAQEIVDELPEAALRQALAEALPDYVRVLMTNSQRPTGQQWDNAQVNGEPIQMMVCGDNKWKPLAECTEEDFDSLARRRIRQAEGNEAWARRYAALADGTKLTGTWHAEESPVVFASIETLTRRRNQLKRDLEQQSSPRLRELQRRRQALFELRAIREAEMRRFALVEDVLRGRERELA